jgi:hypothetical protein
MYHIRAYDLLKVRVILFFYVYSKILSLSMTRNAQWKWQITLIRYVEKIVMC